MLDVPTVPLADGVDLPVLGLGTAGLTGDAAAEAVGWALDAGYRHLDTAWMYRNEEAVGEGLRRSGVPRDEVFVTTKMFPIQISAGRAIEGSLRRLGLEHVDLYLLHFPAGPFTERLWADLQSVRERGLARAVGVSNFGVDHLAALRDGGAPTPSANQIQLSPLHHRRALVDDCVRHDIAPVAYSPLERGKGVGDDGVTAVARRVGRTPAQVMLRWAIQHGFSVIPKSGNRDRIAANARIFDFELGVSEMAILDGLDRTGGTSKPRGR